MNTNSELSPERYREQSLHYLENAQVSLEKGDAEKAGEFLWGGLSQAIKAAAATKGQKLRTHRELWDYTRDLAKQLGDERIFLIFRDANYLHSNYYESELTLEQVASYVDNIKEVVAKLLSFLPGLTQP